MLRVQCVMILSRMELEFGQEKTIMVTSRPTVALMQARSGESAKSSAKS